MHKLYSYNNWHYKNSTQLFFDSQIFFTDKKCSIKRNWFAHDHSFFFFITLLSSIIMPKLMVQI